MFDGLSDGSDLSGLEGPDRNRSTDVYRLLRLRDAMSLQRDLDGPAESAAARANSSADSNQRSFQFQDSGARAARRKRRHDRNQVQPLREHVAESERCETAGVLL